MVKRIFATLHHTSEIQTQILIMIMTLHAMHGRTSMSLKALVLFVLPHI